MRDFDDFFEEKMNEEQRFNGRQKSWNGLEKQLDAFDAGSAGGDQSGTGWLRFWQAIAVVGLLAGGWFLMENNRLSDENASLKMELSKAENQLLRPLLASSPTTSSSKTSQLLPANSVESVVGEDANNGQSVVGEDANNGQKSVVGEDANNGQQAAKTADFKKEKTGGQPDFSEKQEAEKGLPKNELTDSTAVLTDAKLENLQAEIARLTAEKAAIQQQLDEKQAELTQKLEAGQATFAEKLATEKVRFDSLQTVAAALAAVPPAILKPVEMPSRFRLGADYLTGKAWPKEEGTSRLAGHSFSGEWRFRRNFSATVGADFLKYSVEAMDFPKHQHFPEPPKPSQSHPDHEITNVESKREQHNFSLGLKYSAPFGSRFLRPTVGLAHSWVRLPSAFISYKFEDKNGGGGPGGPHDKDPETITQKTDNQWVTSVWRLGLGLEHERQRLVFRVGADWSKSLKKEMPLFDSLIFRGGMSFKF